MKIDIQGIIIVLLSFIVFSASGESLAEIDEYRESSEIADNYLGNMVPGVRLICPNPDIPEYYTGAMNIIQTYLLDYESMVSQAITDYGIKNNYAGSRVQQAHQYYRRQTEMEITWSNPDELNVKERQAVRLYGLSTKLSWAVNRFLDDYCLKAEVETFPFDYARVCCFLDLNIPLILEMSPKKSYMLLGYIVIDNKTTFVAAEISKVTRSQGSVLKGTLAGLHKVKDLKRREEMRQEILRLMQTGREHKINITDTFDSKKLSYQKFLVVFTPEQLRDSKITAIYPPEIDESAIGKLYLWFRFF